ncbi:hypothetical protein ABVK25_012205 [Lepraria finkii]|uniref:Uncharacterized protein n=1 Tax=Lepraria finkii TaxID=1340010 RepID=A0ABR4AK16_9LECA
MPRRADAATAARRRRASTADSATETRGDLRRSDRPIGARRTRDAGVASGRGGSAARARRRRRIGGRADREIEGERDVRSQASPTGREAAATGQGWRDGTGRVRPAGRRGRDGDGGAARPAAPNGASGGDRGGREDPGRGGGIATRAPATARGAIVAAAVRRRGRPAFGRRSLDSSGRRDRAGTPTG